MFDGVLYQTVRVVLLGETLHFFKISGKPDKSKGVGGRGYCRPPSRGVAITLATSQYKNTELNKGCMNLIGSKTATMFRSMDDSSLN